MNILKFKKYYNSGCLHCPSLKFLYVASDPLAQVCNSLNLSPMQITHLSVICSILSILALLLNNILFYSIFLILSISFDVIDGMIARYTNKSSAIGAFYDHTADKFKILFYYIVFGVYYDDKTIWILCTLNLGLFFIMSVFNEKKLDLKVDATSVEQSVENSEIWYKKHFLFKIARYIYRSTFMIYANFMLYFLLVPINKQIATITLIFLCLIIVNSLTRILKLSYIMARNFNLY